MEKVKPPRESKVSLISYVSPELLKYSRKFILYSSYADNQCSSSPEVMLSQSIILKSNHVLPSISLVGQTPKSLRRFACPDVRLSSMVGNRFARSSRRHEIKFKSLRFDSLLRRLSRSAKDVRTSVQQQIVGEPLPYSQSLSSSLSSFWKVFFVSSASFASPSRSRWSSPPSTLGFPLLSPTISKLVLVPSEEEVRGD